MTNTYKVLAAKFTYDDEGERDSSTIISERTYEATNPDEACVMAERDDAGHVDVDWYQAELVS